MMTRTSDAATAREIIDTNLYMTIGTADESGLPWASPVYFTAHDYRELYWVSRHEATHSQNIAVRPEVGVVVFDSQVVPLTGQAVYMTAYATELTGTPAFETGLERFNFARYADPAAHGVAVFDADSVRPPAGLRLYCAVVSQHFVLEPEADRRMPVDP